MTQIVGYIGALFLICRLLPILHEQINNTRTVNVYFVFLEAGASICLGASAILLNAYPFIIANIFSFLAAAFIICLHVYREYWNKNKNTPSTTHSSLDTENSAFEIDEVEV